MNMIATSYCAISASRQQMRLELFANNYPSRGYTVRKKTCIVCFFHIYFLWVQEQTETNQENNSEKPRLF